MELQEEMEGNALARLSERLKASSLIAALFHRENLPHDALKAKRFKDLGRA